MSFLLAKRTVGFKLEAVPYTAEVLAVGDFDFRAYNISYDPDIAKTARKLAEGDFSRRISISGKRSLPFTFSVDVSRSDAVATAPKYWKLLRACGMKQVVHGSTGISLVTSSETTNVPGTIEVVEKDEGASPVQVVVQGRGAMGNAKFVLDNVGMPMRIDFEFKSALIDIFDRAFGSILSPTGFDAALPDAVLSATTSFFAETQKLDTVTTDLGNQVELYTCPANADGWEGAHVVDRNPTLEMDPDLELLATQSDFTRWTGETTGALLITIGDSLQFSAPAAQLIKAYTPGDREGHVTNTKSLELKRGPTGDDELELLQGSKT